MILQEFERWIGWGWAVLFVVWFAGTIFILNVIYRWFMQRFASRLPTAVVFVLWTLAIVVIGGKTFGYGAPPG